MAEYTGNPEAVNAQILGGTIATIQSPITLGNATILVGTVLVPEAVDILQSPQVSTVLNNVVVSVLQASTITAGTLQDLVVDVTYGTVISGSVITAVTGVDPVTNIRTSTIVAGAWYGGTVQTGQRLQVLGPSGQFVAVVVQPAGSGTVTNVTVSAQQSTTG